MIRRAAATLLAIGLLAGPAFAQQKAAGPLFAAERTPAAGPAQVYGQSARGCIAGAVEMPESGPTWQVMRLSRNHDWGHPVAIAFLKDLSQAAVRVGWNGIYVGDLGQARGGPIPGHASHQSGLDVDIWYTPPPRLNLTRAERESLSAINIRSKDQRGLNANWTPAHAALLEATARDPRVNRIFVTAPVKLALCKTAGPGDTEWLRKIRPWWNHHDHFHVRLNCPKGAEGCVDPDPIPPGDGCADAVWWVTDALLPPDPNAPKPKPKPPLTLADLPSQCTAVLKAP